MAVKVRSSLPIFRGEDPGGVLWQPRLDYWYAVNKQRGTLPEVLRDTDDIREVYDYCHASIRYFGNGLRVRYRNVQVTEHMEDEKRLRRTWETPIGALTEVLHYDEWNLSRHNTEYVVKTPEDFRILEYILQDQEWTWDQAAYERDMAQFGDYGAPQFYFPRSPVQALFIEHMGLQAAIYMMHDYPEIVAHYVGVSTERDDALYAVLCQCPVEILNLGENIDSYMDPPPIWCKHLVPYYRKRIEQLHAAGKFVHIHLDGSMRPLLPHLRDCPWDGIEALTPLPQGDITLEEMKAAVGDAIVVLDGIPALLFLPSYAEDELIACAKRLVELFYPRLVLGISDEIPPDGSLERMRLVGELVQDLI